MVTKVHVLAANLKVVYIAKDRDSHRIAISTCQSTEALLQLPNQQRQSQSTERNFSFLQLSTFQSREKTVFITGKLNDFQPFKKLLTPAMRQKMGCAGRFLPRLHLLQLLSTTDQK